MDFVGGVAYTHFFLFNFINVAIFISTRKTPANARFEYVTASSTRRNKQINKNPFDYYDYCQFYCR